MIFKTHIDADYQDKKQKRKNWLPSKSAGLLFLFCILAFHSWGKQVEIERARQVAAAFMNNLPSHSLKSVSTNDMEIVPLTKPGENRLKSNKSSQISDEQLVYLFKLQNNGFVLVAGDDLAMPILGYSSTEQINSDNLPVNFLKWVETYKKQIKWLQNNPDLKSSSTNNYWEQLEREGKYQTSSTTALAPLLTTKWNQSPYYNDLCPQQYWYSEKAVTGCVATAMAQIMKYHNHPKQGTGMHSYFHSTNTVTYGTVSANFGATSYDWKNMPNTLTASSSAAQKKAVATLMLHCGVSVDMSYSPESSGAYVIEKKSYGTNCSEFAFKEYFDYDKKTVKGVERQGMTTTQWINTLKTELNAKRPVLLAGFGGRSGHAFVTDGYDNNNFFHINWGWGGTADGYFSVDAFNPSNLGTGAGYGTYNDNQCAVIGIKPTITSNPLELYLYSNITVPKIYQFDEFQIDLQVRNMGADFYGDLCAALFNSKKEFVDYIDQFSLKDTPLLKGKLYNVWFDSEGLSVYPGKYYIGIYYKPVGSNWIILPEVPDGGVTNFIPVDILSPFEENDIKLYDSIFVSPKNPMVGQPISVTTKIANFGTSTYRGEFGAGIFDIDGKPEQTIDLIDAENLSSNYYNTYTFSDPAVDVVPGTYLIGLVHLPANTDDQFVIAPNKYINPITVDITVPELAHDGFENNDDVDNAARLSTNFKNNYYGLFTDKTNIHSAVDEDYYKIIFPTGYNYTINARVNDSFDSEKDEDFTCDVMWAHSIGNEWSTIYDDVMDKPYVLKNGGTVYFGVIPYFEGLTGTYSLSIKINRELATDVNRTIDEQLTNIFPNPANNKVFISSSINMIESINMIDQTGRIVKTEQIQKSDYTMEVANLARGMYLLQVTYNNKVETHKILLK